MEPEARSNPPAIEQKMLRKKNEPSCACILLHSSKSVKRRVNYRPSGSFFHRRLQRFESVPVCIQVPFIRRRSPLIAVTLAPAGAFCFF